MKITAVGDCAIQKSLPRFYDGFDIVKDYINRADVRFFNLETNVCEDCYPGKHSGGTWLRTSPEILCDMKEFGFNVTTNANNHCMDFSYDGFLQTIKNIKETGFRSSGGGRNLAEAARPVYIDTQDGRAAIISCTTTFSPGAEAGEQSRDFVGRPGINNLTVERTVHINEDDMHILAEIADKTMLNANNKILIKQGYVEPEKNGELNFGGIKFKQGKPRVKYEMSKSDVERILRSVKDAVFQADIVIVSIHSHETETDSKEDVPDFLRDFAHQCIDSGAHAIIGHGPHLIRPVEIYKGMPIFYSLGNFVLHLENCEILPYDYCQKYGLTPDSGVYEVFKKRTKDFTVGLQRQKEMTEAIIPYFEIKDGKLLSLEFMPIELGFGKTHASFGWPKKAEDNEIIKRLSKMSNIEITEDGKAIL